MFIKHNQATVKASANSAGVKGKTDEVKEPPKTDFTTVLRLFDEKLKISSDSKLKDVCEILNQSLTAGTRCWRPSAP